MLIELIVRNFRSFRKETVFSMVAAPSYKEHKESNTFDAAKKLLLLTSCVCYGANASGKSNLIKAFRFLRDLVIQSSSENRLNSPIPAIPFAFSSETKNMPTFIEISFIVDSTIFRYGFEANSQKVLKEWLYESTSSREAMLFDREEQNISLGNRFKKEGQGLSQKTRENALFLSVAANFNSNRAKKITNWFHNANAIEGSFGGNCRDITLNMIEEQSEEKQRFLKYLQVADLDIDDFSLDRRELDDEKDIPLAQVQREFLTFFKEKVQNFKIRDDKVRTTHALYDTDQKKIGTTDLDLFADESSGTRRFFCMLGPLQDTLSKGKILFVDELDSSFHSMMTRFIVSLFNNPETNPHHAQFIFTTHSTNLLDKNIFRRDQVWFIEKNRFGESDLFSLAEFKPRTDERLEKSYLAGRYGAIPNIRDFLLSSEANGETNGENE